MKTRRGLPVLLAGLGLLAYVALTPKTPAERHVTYRFAPAASAGRLEIRWSDEHGEPVGAARFEGAADQRQSSHRLLLSEGDYQLDAELPNGVFRARRVHVDAESFTVVLE